MHPVLETRPSLAELTEIERLDSILARLSRRADNGPRGLAHAALAAGLSTQSHG
ncbi:hypothetical protein [Roseovarius sp. 2305UL8-3]|uniref:hypothetical protein n=1 Tax=Roseovarius conchicola TaxID=3121636 RepID=UPI00352886B1